MIRLTVELLPGGYADASRRTIGMMHLSNLTDLADQSNYETFIMEAANPLAGTEARAAQWKVANHDRNQSVWRLIKAALDGFDQADWEPF